MRAVDFQTVEAAQNMGASQIRILLRVVLPVLTPSLLAVTILTFITGLSATSAPLYRGIYLFYIRKTPCYGMGQQRTDRQERAQTVVKDAVQKEAQANADVPSENCGEGAGKEEK